MASLVALALASPLLGGRVAQANPLQESEQEGIESVSETPMPIGSDVSVPSIVEWGEKPFYWIEEPFEWIGELPPWQDEHLGPGGVLVAQKLLSITEPSEDTGQERRYIDIKAVEVSVESGKVVIFTGVLPTPCHQLGWEIPEAASPDGVLRIQAWTFDRGDFCLQALQPFSARISLGTTPFDRVSVNDVLQSSVMPMDRSGSSAVIQPFMRGASPDGGITATPGPLPVAAALAGWQSARRLRRRCKPIKHWSRPTTS